MSKKSPNNSIYSVKSRWKIYLGIAGILLILAFLAYTYYLSEKLKEEERHKVTHIALAIKTIQNPDSHMTLVSKILEDNTTTPLILVNDRGGIDSGKNFEKEQNNDTIFLRKELNFIIKSGGEPHIVTDKNNTQYIYYQQSKLLTQLNYMPFVLLLLIGVFIVLGYLAFSAARQTEQNLVWVGMAKETAHQLGTPITAIIAWIEHLKMMNPDEATQNVVNELQKDVTRLELIAERFSKVGSTPELFPTDINIELQKVMEYMQARSPKRMKFSLEADRDHVMANINPPLFDWVIENLLRNALDAMEGQGNIDIRMATTERRIIIHISDTGKGIPSSKLKTIFNPGYTTKTRGWGLGLSLSKRIVESYHSGRIFVKSSTVAKGTTFEIDLPLNNPL